jgi:hypothetical protein
LGKVTKLVQHHSNQGTQFSFKDETVTKVYKWDLLEITTEHTDPLPDLIFTVKKNKKASLLSKQSEADRFTGVQCFPVKLVSMEEASGMLRQDIRPLLLKMFSF